MNLNPDENINVVIVFPDGLAVTYGHADEFGVRQRLHSQKHSTYGAARLAAVDYEAKQREERARRAK